VYEKDVGGGCEHVYPTVLYLASGFCIMIQFPPGPLSIPLGLFQIFYENKLFTNVVQHFHRYHDTGDN
jgi:hypothetical protein